MNGQLSNDTFATQIDSAVLDEAYIGLVTNGRLHETGRQDGASIVVRQCALTLQASRASIWLMSDDKTALSCLSLYVADEDRFESGAVIDAASFPSYFDALLGARVINARDAFEDPRTRELRASYLEPLNVRTLLDATLRQDGNVQGVLCVELVARKRDWSQAEQIFVASVADLMTQRFIVDQLTRSQDRYKTLFENTNEGIGVFSGPSFADVNPAMCRIFGASRDELIGLSPIELSPERQPDGQPSATTALTLIGACLAGTPQCFEWQHRRLDGTVFDAEVQLNAATFAGEDTLFCLIRDITFRKDADRAARAARRELEYRATHDSLTGLCNRARLHEHVDGLIARNASCGGDESIALLLLDLNRFKEINDTLGHATGDKLLVRLSRVLNEEVEAMGGLLFRLGGDEFVAAFDSGSCTEAFVDLETRLCRCLKTPIDLDDITVELGASIGVAVYPDNGKDSHELLRCADVAMYYAKNNDGASSWYEPGNDLNNKRRLAMMVELGTAIRDDQLLLHYQPRIDVRTGEVTGCEALIRWQHPTLGMVPPGEFMPLAEMSDLIHPLSAWVLKSALEESRHLRSCGYRVPIAINVSARNLTDSHFVDYLENLIVVENVEPGSLEIEITESALINHPQRAVQNLNRMDELGVPIAIDDFGTGYSSLSYLKRLPLHTLKIDRSFVMDMRSDESDSVIVDSTINLAHNFSLTVVAEGVEDQETLDALDAKGCDQAQGFFIARPMPAEDLQAWLDDYHVRRSGVALAG